MSLSISSTGLTPPDPSALREKMFKRVDTDGDGAVSKDELKTMLENGPKRPDQTSETNDTDELFTKFDTDGDGSLNQTELDEGMKSMGPPPPRPNGASFQGSSDMLDSILSTLSNSDDSDSVSLSDQQKEFIQQLVQQLKTNGLYNEQGSAGSSSGSASLFGTTA